MKYLILFMLLFIFTACDNPQKKYVSIDIDNEVSDDADNDFDADIETDSDTSEVNLEFLTVIRVRKDLEFPKNESRFIVQKAELDMDSLKVERTLNNMDTSFSMHKDDVVSIRNILNAEFEKNGCSVCEKGAENYLEFVLKSEEVCCVTDALEIEELDRFMIIPIHSMLWPFSPQNDPHPVGHTTLNIQRYSDNYGEAYFHQGVDIVKDEPVDIFNPYDGRVTETGYYRTEETGGESPYYFQVVVKTVNGLQFQFHHTDTESVPEEIYNIEGSDTILKAGSNTGKIVFWPTPDSSSGKFFHHVHFNVLNEKGIKLNPLELMIPQNDKTPPVIDEMFLIDADRTKTLSNDGIAEKFHVVIKAEDLVENDPWPNPPRYSDVQITDAEGAVVYQHAGYDAIVMLSANELDFVCEYYLCEMSGSQYSKGDYSNREFYIVTTAFDREGEQTEAISNELFYEGQYSIRATSCDESDNCSEKYLNISF
ncbi:MAG TPA: hypothetical protein PKG52_11240 [bacterium]|nr:hypothetical protein [bacterium]